MSAFLSSCVSMMVMESINFSCSLLLLNAKNNVKHISGSDYESRASCCSDVQGMLGENCGFGRSMFLFCLALAGLG